MNFEHLVVRHISQYYDATEKLEAYSAQLRDAAWNHDLDTFKAILEDIQNAYQVLGTVINQLGEDAR